MISFKDISKAYRKKQESLCLQFSQNYQTEVRNLIKNCDFDKFATIGPDEDIIALFQNENPSPSSSPTSRLKNKPPVPPQKRNLLEEARKNIHHDRFTNSERMNSEIFSILKDASIKPNLKQVHGSLAFDLKPQFEVTPKPKGMTLTKGQTLTVELDSRNLCSTSPNKKSNVKLNIDGEKIINQFRCIRELGKGAFGKVELAVDQNTNIEYAIKAQSKKMMKKKAFTVSKESFNMLQREIAIMKKIVSRC